MISRTSILCVGYAKLPTGMSAETVYKTFGVGLLVEPDSGIIVNAETTSTTRIGDEFLVSMMVGRNIEEIEEIVKELERRYLGVGAKAIVAALNNSYGEYLKYLDRKAMDIS
ncbi:MAG: DUF3870 domain-containing protein [Desulfitobacteriaceae bacterium]